MTDLQDARKKLDTLRQLVDIGNQVDANDPNVTLMNALVEALTEAVASAEEINAAYPMAELIARAIDQSKVIQTRYIAAYVKDGDYAAHPTFTEAGARHIIRNQPRWVIALKGELIGYQEAPLE